MGFILLPRRKPVPLFRADMTVDLSLRRGSGAATFARATAGLLRDSAGLWQEAAIDTPRHYFAPSLEPVGVLLGGPRTNLCLNSCMSEVTEGALDDWNAHEDEDSISGIASATAMSPAITAYEAKLKSGSEAEVAGISQTIPVDAATKHAFMFGYRDIGAGYLRFCLYDEENETYLQADGTWDAAPTWLAIPRRTTRTVYEWATSGGLTCFTTAAGCANLTVEFATDGAAKLSEHRIHFVDLSPGAYPTQPIKTTTEPVERAASSLSFPTAGNFLAAAGTIVLDVTPEFAAAAKVTDSVVLDLTDATPDGLKILHSQASDCWKAIVYSGGAAVATLNSITVPVRGTPHRIVLAWRINDFALYVQGVSEATDTAGAAPAALGAAAYIGQDRLGANQACAAVRKLLNYGTRLTVAEIAAMGRA